MEQLNINFNPVNVLVFYDQEYWFGSTDRIIKQYHGQNTMVFHANVNKLIGDNPDRQFLEELAGYIKNHRIDFFYIIPQDRRRRSALRYVFKQKTGVDIHIGIFNNLEQTVQRNKLLKPTFESIRKSMMPHDLSYTLIARSPVEYEYFREQGFEDKDIVREFGKESENESQ